MGMSKRWYVPVIICRLRKDTSKHVGFSCVNLETSTGLPLHMNRRRWHGLNLSQKTALFLASLLSFFPVVRTLWAAVCTHQSLTSQETFRNWFSNYRSTNDIMELQSRPVKFSDLVAFVDCEARIATNPVFGYISSFAQSGSGSARSPSQSSAGPASSKVKTSTFVTQVQNNRRTNSPG